MDEVVGLATGLCTQHAMIPRSVFHKHLNEPKQLMQRGAGKP